MQTQETIVVTGASRGIGEAITHRLAQKGHRLVLLARTEARLDQICREISEHGGSAEFIRADLCSPEAAREAAAAILERCPRVDGLVVNAGVSNNRLFTESSLEQLDYELGVNYLAPAVLIRHLLPRMIAHRRGHIVAVGSLTALVPFPGNASYAASKAALLALMRSLSIEVRPHGIQVSTVLPGLTRTQLSHGMDSFLPSMDPDQVAKAVEQCLEDGSPIAIPGLDNKLAVLLYRLFPLAFDRGVGLAARLLVPGYGQSLMRLEG